MERVPMVGDVWNEMQRMQRGTDQLFGESFGWAPSWTHPTKLLPGKSTGGLSPPSPAPKKPEHRRVDVK